MKKKEEREEEIFAKTQSIPIIEHGASQAFIRRNIEDELSWKPVGMARLDY